MFVMNSLPEESKKRYNQLSEARSQKSEVKRHMTNDICQKLEDNEIDLLIKQVEDILDPEFRRWAVGRIFELGPNEFLARADQARKFAKYDVMHYFSKLLKLR